MFYGNFSFQNSQTHGKKEFSSNSVIMLGDIRILHIISLFVFPSSNSKMVLGDIHILLSFLSYSNSVMVFGDVFLGQT